MTTLSQTRRTLGRPSILLIGGAVLALIAATAAAAQLTRTTSAPATELQFATTGLREFAIAAVVAKVLPDDLVLTLTDTGGVPRSRIDLLSRASGTRVGAVELAFYGMGVVRASRNELLLSDIVADGPDGSGEPHPRLFILDLASGLALKGGTAIDMPGRATYTVYAPALLLSSDEKTLYYLRITPCGAGCDDFAVVGIDLDRRQEVSAVALPRNCGYAQLTLATSGVAALCPELNSVWLVHDGAARRLASFDGGWLIAAGTAPDGAVYAISQTGHLSVRSASGSSLIERDLVTAPRRFSGVDRFVLDQGRIALGVKTGADSLFDSVMVLNSRNWTTHSFDVPTGSTHASYLGGDQLAVLSGTNITVFDSTGRSLRSLPANGAQWLVNRN